ncbi:MULTISPECIES: hypothetical protein [unclassified Streptomyces]
MHLFGAQVRCLFRSYVVYRGRDPEELGPRPERRAQEKTGA